MYVLRFLITFPLTYNKIIKGNGENEKRTKKAFNFLQQNPFHPSPKSHKVNTKNFGVRRSSWVSGDLRIIWDFDPQEKMIIVIFAIAKHTGKYKEYK